MSVPLSNEELDHLLAFVGYGTPDADVWFLGMEEAGGGEDNIRTRLEFQTVEDNAEAHKMLEITKHHWGRRVIQRTWRAMCYIMLRLENQEPSTENIRRYQAEQLGRSQGNTLLTELMPIPKPSVGSWGYEELISQFSSREDYYQQIRPRRVQLLRQLVAQHNPQVIIAYGKAFWPDYKGIFSDMTFRTNDQFEVASQDGLLVILTAHFTARTMNGKLDDLVNIVRQYPSLDINS